MGVFECLFEAVASDLNMEWLVLAATMIRVRALAVWVVVIV